MAAHAHIALAEAVRVVGARDTLARLTVLRNGNSDGVASFTWRTAAGTARSGVEFDRFAPHVAKFPAGARSLELRIPLHPDARRPQAKNLYVMIAPSAPDFSHVTRHTTMIKIKTARWAPSRPVIQRCARRNDPGASQQVRTRPRLLERTNPQCSSTPRCCMTAGSDMVRGRANSLTDASPDRPEPETFRRAPLRRRDPFVD